MVKVSLDRTSGLKNILVGVTAFIVIEVFSLYLHFFLYPNLLITVLIAKSLLGSAIYLASFMGGMFSGLAARERGWWYGGLSGVISIMLVLSFAMILGSLSLIYSNVDVVNIPSDSFQSRSLSDDSVKGTVILVTLATFGGWVGEVIAKNYKKGRRN